jgi:hypothetical protein
MKLTPRIKHALPIVIDMTNDGAPQRDIAAAAGIAISTVNRILEKLPLLIKQMLEEQS